MESRFYEQIQVLDRIQPVSTSTQVNGVAGWVQVKNFQKFLAIFQAGVIANTGTIVFRISEAVDSSGTGAKVLKAATAFADDDDGKTVVVECKSDQLSDGYSYIRIEIVAATAASLVSGLLLAYDVNHTPVSTALLEEVAVL